MLDFFNVRDARGDLRSGTLSKVGVVMKALNCALTLCVGFFIRFGHSAHLGALRVHIASRCVRLRAFAVKRG